MNLTLIFKELYKPILYTMKQLGAMFINSENWWISKSPYTKLNLRWVLFTVILFTTAVFREVKAKENELVYYNRSIDDNLLLQKKNTLLEQRYLRKLEEDIKELKDIRKIAERNDKQIKNINK